MTDDVAGTIVLLLDAPPSAPNVAVGSIVLGEKEAVLSKVTGILVQVITGDVANAGTDGNVYLGLGGREFRIDSRADDFERNSWREYVMGHGGWSGSVTPVLNPQWNDPATGSSWTRSISRGAPSTSASSPGVRARTGTSGSRRRSCTTLSSWSRSRLPPGFDNLWLGDEMGKILYLTDAYWQGEEPVRGFGAEIAERAKATLG